MKKLLFLFMLIGGATVHLKAQNRFEVKPFGKQPDSFTKPYKYKFGDSLTRLFPQNPNLTIPQRIDSRKADLSRQYAYNPMPIVKPNIVSNMPVVKMEGNSKMPVVNPDAGIIEYRRRPLP